MADISGLSGNSMIANQVSGRKNGGKGDAKQPMSFQEQLLGLIQERKEEILDKVENGKTEEEIQIGGASFTDSQWKKLIHQFDDAEDTIREEQKERIDKEQEEELQKRSLADVIARETGSEAK